MSDVKKMLKRKGEQARRGAKILLLLLVEILIKPTLSSQLSWVRHVTWEKMPPSRMIEEK